MLPGLFFFIYFNISWKPVNDTRICRIIFLELATSMKAHITWKEILVIRSLRQLLERLV